MIKSHESRTRIRILNFRILRIVPQLLVFVPVLVSVSGHHRVNLMYLIIFFFCIVATFFAVYETVDHIINIYGFPI